MHSIPSPSSTPLALSAGSLPSRVVLSVFASVSGGLANWAVHFMRLAITMLSTASCSHVHGSSSMGSLRCVACSEFCGWFGISCGVAAHRTDVPSVRLALLPSAEASWLTRGSSMPRVERSFVVDRSSSLSCLRDLHLREFRPCCDDFHEFFACSVAVPTLSVSFVLVASFFAQGSSIG